MTRCLSRLRSEAVLCVAIVLAAVSAFVVPPDAAYLSYVDWDTLLLLFSLMAVMAGYRKLGVFDGLAGRLLRHVSTSRQMLLVLVLLPFLFSMVITNDVSLITFVPFGLIVLRQAEQTQLAVPLVAMQTLAANLGSMCTPMGNPQNLYLYGRSGMSLGAFLLLTLPYVALSGVLLALLAALRKSAPVEPVAVAGVHWSRRGLVCCTTGFALCLLSVAGLIPPVAIAAVTALFLLLRDRRLLAGLDYGLLGTFVGFFIFVGNMGHIGPFRSFLESILTGHERLVAVLASQVISNVPAALLLSGFTDRWDALIVGTNLGGLGTLIASMASLISYKQLVREYPERRGRYLAWFTLSNLLLLLILLAFSFLWPF